MITIMNLLGIVGAKGNKAQCSKLKFTVLGHRVFFADCKEPS